MEVVGIDGDGWDGDWDVDGDVGDVWFGEIASSALLFMRNSSILPTSMVVESIILISSCFSTNPLMLREYFEQ